MVLMEKSSGRCWVSLDPICRELSPFSSVKDFGFGYRATLTIFNKN
jgi:hypothetical protein